MVDTRDILLKAASDVESGMWCKLHWFRDVYHVAPTADTLLAGEMSIEDAQASKRCAQGSLGLATVLLGGGASEYNQAKRAAAEVLFEQRRVYGGLVEFNDNILPDDPFEAGQQLAELFRSTAASL